MTTLGGSWWARHDLSHNCKSTKKERIILLFVRDYDFVCRKIDTFNFIADRGEQITLSSACNLFPRCVSRVLALLCRLNHRVYGRSGTGTAVDCWVNRIP
jgi:hypothetical protein